jgi:release factor glutamine methyltransferase
MPSPAECIAQARAVLARAGIPDRDAAFDAEMLARHVLSWDRARLIAHGREPSPDGFAAAFDRVVARRAQREPVAQIVGSREFWGLEFEVTPDVLIPRPETELIVEEAVRVARERPCRTAVEVGTGSGCIAIACALEIPGLHVTAVDSSERAVEVARRNASRHGVSDRVSIRRGDLLDGIAGPVDLILSNPPYVPDRDAATLQPEVVKYEPAAALFAGEDGLAVIRRLLADAGTRLAADGTLLFEFGVGQAEEIRSMAYETGWNLVRMRDDLQGIPRTAVFFRSLSS